MAGKLQFTLEEYQDAARKYRKDLLMLPIIGIQDTLKFMTGRPGIRYKESVAALNGNAQFAPYKPARRTNFNLDLDFRTLETFFGSVVAQFEPNSAISTLLGAIGDTKGDGQIQTPTAKHVLALIASVIMAVILYSLSSNAGNSIPQEITEGVTALLAVAVLIYVSNWMISKAESEAWTNYISDKVKGSADSGKMIALGATAFLAVFREGAEVILFCQQYFSRAGSMQNGFLAVFGGILLGLAAVALIFVLIRVFGVKIPLKPFFMATSILMAVMSIAFLGSGMWELFLDGGLAEMIGGWVQSLSVTIPALSWMSGNDALAFFGIYPTWITLIPQLILLVITVITFVLTIRKKPVSAGAKDEQQEETA